MRRTEAHTDMIYSLDRLQEDLMDNWLDQSLPDDWNGMDTYDDVRRAKTRVTVRLDADMVRWFRKMGPGYGARINMILRIYWTALLSGHVRAHYRDDVTPRLMLEARRLSRELNGGGDNKT